MHQPLPFWHMGQSADEEDFVVGRSTARSSVRGSVARRSRTPPRRSRTPPRRPRRSRSRRGRREVESPQASGSRRESDGWRERGRETVGRVERKRRRDKSPSRDSRHDSPVAKRPRVTSRRGAKRPAVVVSSESQPRIRRRLAGKQSDESYRGRSPPRIEPPAPVVPPVLVASSAVDVVCTHCGGIIAANEERYKFCRMHWECGHEREAGRTYLRRRPDLSAKFDSLDSGVQRQIVDTLKTGASGSRDFGAFEDLIMEESRSKIAQNVGGRIRCDKQEFWKHWEGRGRKEPEIKAKWRAATSKQAIENGDCQKVKRKKIVWVTEQEREKKIDETRNTCVRDRGADRVSKSSAQNLEYTTSSIPMPTAPKRSLRVDAEDFGDDSCDSSEDDNEGRVSRFRSTSSALKSGTDGSASAVTGDVNPGKKAGRAGV